MCSGLTGRVSRGAAGAAMSTLGHGSPEATEIAQKFFFLGGWEVLFLLAQPGGGQTLLSFWCCPVLWLGVRWWPGALRAHGTEILAGDGMQMVACVSAVICKTVHLLRCSLLAVSRHPWCCTGQILPLQ